MLRKPISFLSSKWRLSNSVVDFQERIEQSANQVI
jgi:hypothetical protein